VIITVGWSGVTVDWSRLTGVIPPITRNAMDSTKIQQSPDPLSKDAEDACISCSLTAYSKAHELVYSNQIGKPVKIFLSKYCKRSDNT